MGQVFLVETDIDSDTDAERFRRFGEKIRMVDARRVLPLWGYWA